MSYPDDIDEFREMVNIPGLDYNSDDTKTIFAEDLNAYASAITQIEEFIGANDAAATSPLFQLFLDLIYPVGRIVHFATGADPNDTYTWQTWELWGEGRVLVGQDSADTTFDTLGEEVGEKEHELTEGELAEHEHQWPNSSDLPTGATNDGIQVIGDTSNSGGANRYTTDNDGSPAPTSAAGSGDPHNNIQPSKVGVRWVRTA